MKRSSFVLVTVLCVAGSFLLACGTKSKKKSSKEGEQQEQLAELHGDWSGECEDTSSIIDKSVSDSIEIKTGNEISYTVNSFSETKTCEKSKQVVTTTLEGTYTSKTSKKLERAYVVEIKFAKAFMTLVTQDAVDVANSLPDCSGMGWKKGVAREVTDKDQKCELTAATLKLLDDPNYDSVIQMSNVSKDRFTRFDSEYSSSGNVFTKR